MDKRLHLWAIAAVWLASLLACDFSGLGQTVTATPNLSPQLSPSPVSSVSQRPAPTATPVATAFPTATLDPLATPVTIEPCTLITQDDAASAIGEPVQPGVSAGGGCVYVDSSVGQYFLSTYAVTSTNAPSLIEGRVYLLVAYGAQVSQTQLANVKSLGLQGDAHGVIESLMSLAGNTSAFSVQAVDGVGDKAIWVSKLNGSVRQSFLLAARGDALVGLDVIVTSARDESSVRDSAVAVIKQMLNHLPARFMVAIPTRLPTVSPTQIVSQTASTPSTVVPSPTGVSATPPQPGMPTNTPTVTPSVGSQTVTITPTLKPPAFSVPIVSSNLVTYGGSCGLSLVSLTVTVADPSQISPITKVSLFVRVNDPVRGQVTEFTELPLRVDRNNVWLTILNAETQLPGHEKYSQAFIEYYFLATNSVGVSAESPRYGVQSNQLTLTACITPTPSG